MYLFFRKRRSGKSLAALVVLFWFSVPGTAQGQGLDDIRWQTESGEISNIATPSRESLKGRAVVLSFWSMNCSTCLSTLSKSAKLAEKYANEGVVFIWLNTHDQPGEAIDSLIVRHGSIVFAYDSAQATWTKYGEPPWGRVLVFNTGGKVAWMGVTHELDSSILESVLHTGLVHHRRRYYVEIAIERVVKLTEASWTVDQSESGLRIVLENMLASDLVTKLYKLAYGTDDNIECKNVPETMMLYNVDIRLSGTKLLSSSLEKALAQLVGFFNISMKKSTPDETGKVEFEFSEYRDLQE